MTTTKKARTTKSSAHEANMDAAQRSMDAREADGENMAGYTIDPTTYALIPPVSVVATLAAQLVAAPTPAQTGAKAPRNTTPDLTLVVGKNFKPRTDQTVAKKADGKGNFAQQHNWDALVAAIQAHGGAISYAEAVQAVADAAKDGGYEKTANARGFVQGRVRGGHLVAA